MTDKLAEIRRVAEQILAILDSADRPDERGEAEWIKLNSRGFCAGCGAEPSRAATHDGSCSEMQRLFPNPIPYASPFPTAPTTGDEGKAEERDWKRHEPPLNQLNNPGEGIHWRGTALQEFLDRQRSAGRHEFPPHQAQTHAFARCSYSTLLPRCSFCVVHSGEYKCHLLGCAQPESAPCHGREGK